MTAQPRQPQVGRTLRVSRMVGRTVPVSRKVGRTLRVSRMVGRTVPVSRKVGRTVPVSRVRAVPLVAPIQTAGQSWTDCGPFTVPGSAGTPRPTGNDMNIQTGV
jgi:hypothetical protein